MAIPRLLTLLVVARGVLSQDACYFPGGAFAETYRPCPGPNNSTTSVCCNADMSYGFPKIDPCMSNGFCFSMDLGVPYRGACTEKDWGSTECQKSRQCNEVNRNATTPLQLCQNNQFCCLDMSDPSATSGCCNSTATFEWNDGTFNGPLNASTLLNVTDVSAASIAGMPSATATPEDDGNTVSQDAVIGVGVGLGVPLLAAIAAIFWLVFALKREKNAKTKEQPFFPDQKLDVPQQPHPYGSMSSNGYMQSSPMQSASPPYGYPTEPKGPASPAAPAPPLLQRAYTPRAELEQDRPAVEAPGNTTFQ